MLHNYVVIACRSLIRNKVFSFINVLGLSVSLTAFILILLYVRFELSYDRFHEYPDNIYRVTTKVTLDNEVINHESATYDGIIKALKTEFTEVKALTVISAFSSEKTFIRYEDVNKDLKPIESFRGLYADDHFFDVFSYPLTKGEASNALRDPYSAVVSESVASLHLDGDAIGKVLEFKDDENPPKKLLVTGVIKDLPENSHLKFDILINLPEDDTNFFDANVGFWDWRGHAYILVSNEAIPQEIQNKLDQVAVAHNGLKRNKDDYGHVSTFQLQPLLDIHLFSQLDYEFEPGGRAELVYSLLILAVIILVMAWVNYVNLSTAISTQKIKEVGIRKVMGARRRALMFQVLMEAALLNLLSIAVALCLSWILFPAFRELVGVPVNFISFADLTIWTAILVFLTLSTAFSGMYPALLISSLYPVAALKGKNWGINLLFQRGLVVFQFTAAVILMVVTMVAYEQLSFMQSRELGININQVLVIKALNFDKEKWSDAAGGFVVDSTYQEKAELFKKELSNYSTVINTTSLSHLPGQTPDWGTEFKAADIDPEKAYRLKAIGVEYNFITTFKARLLAGRNFSPDYPTDQGNEVRRAVLINEAVSRLLGFNTPKEAVSRHISTYWGADYEIIGVVNSFHQLSVKENLTPLYFILQPRALSYFAVSFKTSDVAHAIEQVKTSWHRHFPDYPFNYFFLDEFFDQQYKNEKNFGRVVGIFTVLAMFIGCMGLFGLTSYAIVQRTKEIGIRKVLGASLLNVIVLFSADFVKLVLIANTIAIPLMYYGITLWLDNYAYKIPLIWWLFVAPIGVMLTIALLTVSVQTIHLATRNPVDTLKHE